MAKEDGASVEIINQLESASVIPFFENKFYREIPATEWGKFLYPAHYIKNNSNFVWTFISSAMISEKMSKDMFKNRLHGMVFLVSMHWFNSYIVFNSKEKNKKWKSIFLATKFVWMI